MGSAGLSSEIKIANPLERSIVADLSVAAMGGVIRGRIDVENLAIQLISDSARYAVQQSYANSSVSDEYHQSQRASRGEGHITQTTVDQQWESHLINDAEFTANTQLPSVTLDVNDSYVSQQLGQQVGEEVSHFYHPTPPPPRNPSGFWRGVDDVLKMQEGSRKVANLIFTGNYEAPRDSWETAGFMIGAPLAWRSMARIGAERLGAEAIENVYQGSQQLGKGLMQASRIMNRWGLFGGNKAKSSEQAIIRARVEANVAETRAGSNTSSYKVLTAKENQLVKGYHPDDWTMIQLRKGDVLYGGRPGQSNYYTNIDIDTVLASEGDTTALSRSLQIEPHPTKGFRPGIGEYVVQRDIRVPGGIVRSNPMLGPGGTQQYFINNYSNLLSLRNEYTLEEFYESQLSSSILRP